MPDLSISSITAREVLDCRGLPTVQVDCRRRRRAGARRRARPGARPDRHEAHELRDGGARFGGFGVRTRRRQRQRSHRSRTWSATTPPPSARSTPR